MLLLSEVLMKWRSWIKMLVCYFAQGQYDASNAIIPPAGAGGTEVMDWAAMLRMYQDGVKTMDMKSKHWIFCRDGPGSKHYPAYYRRNAYGYLKAEKVFIGWRFP